MFKLVIFALAVCSASAGLIAGGLGHGGLLAAPALTVAHAPIAVAHAPIAVAHAAATSWQNNNQISLNPTAVVSHAPVAVAHAPIAVAHAAPIALSVGHVGLDAGLAGHGLYH